jgi:hypothetical protein
MIKRFNKETKTYKLFDALRQGQRITASDAQKRFGIGNLSAEVSRVRQYGFAVYRKQRRAGNNVLVTEYVMGAPSQEIVAAGYRALAAGI